MITIVAHVPILDSRVRIARSNVASMVLPAHSYDSLLRYPLRRPFSVALAHPDYARSDGHGASLDRLLQTCTAPYWV